MLDNLDRLSWLGFVNTVEPRTGPVVRDALADYPAMVDWAAGAGVIHGAVAASLHRHARADPGAAEATFRGALRLREALFAVFVALARDREPAPAAVAVLHRQFRAANRAAHWEITAAGIRWRWSGDDLDRVAHQIAIDAVDSIGTPLTTRLRQCPPADGGCGWLFVDTTKNRSRRWCSMADCGSRSKTRRQAAKRKAARTHASARPPR